VSGLALALPHSLATYIEIGANPACLPTLLQSQQQTAYCNDVLRAQACIVYLKGVFGGSEFLANHTAFLCCLAAPSNPVLMDAIHHAVHGHGAEQKWGYLQ
jgi:hypothetical protein